MFSRKLFAAFLAAAIVGANGSPVELEKRAANICGKRNEFPFYHGEPGLTPVPWLMLCDRIDYCCRFYFQDNVCRNVPPGLNDLTRSAEADGGMHCWAFA